MLRMRTLALLVTLIVVVTLTVPSSVASPAATSPTLGTADSFAVLAGTPNITNIPTSNITGDVGLSPAPGSGIGLTCVEVTGTIYSVDATGPLPCRVTDPVLLTTVKSDLSSAYDALSAVPNVTCLVDYGDVTKDLAGSTLVPGVYCANVFTLLSSAPLILDDTGAPNGVWIFRTTSAAASLVTTPGVGARVQFLTGVASACNVWWKVTSSATIGGGTTFVGNILALTSISLGTGASLNGRALARNGAVTLDQNIITRPICALAAQSITTHIHNAAHAEVFSAPIGTIVHDMAIVTGTTSITPTGTVSFTVFANQTCAGVGTFAGAVPLNGAGVADPSNTATLTNAGLSYLAHYTGDANYVPADGPCEVLGVLAAPTITTEIHDTNHVDVTNTTVPTNTIVHDMALVTGALGIPTGIVSFTVYANSTCSAPGTFAGAIPLDDTGVADPSYTATLTSAGLSYLAHYNGNQIYPAADGSCEVLNAIPTAVELLYFQADPLGDQQVQLTWATALEVDNFGFNLYRANEDDLTHASLIHFEPAVTQGSGSGGTYAYVDTAPAAGAWWYWLSDVDTKGRETVHANPINLTVPSGTLLYHVYLPCVAQGN